MDFKDAKELPLLSSLLRYRDQKQTGFNSKGGTRGKPREEGRQRKITQKLQVTFPTPFKKNVKVGAMWGGGAGGTKRKTNFRLTKAKRYFHKTGNVGNGTPSGGLNYQRVPRFVPFAPPPSLEGGAPL